jgi:hypothetical protein
VPKMAKRTQKEIKALKDAGYVYNQREQRWMSPEDWQKWEDNQKHEDDINNFMKWLYILFFAGLFVYVFASSMN